MTKKAWVGLWSLLITWIGGFALHLWTVYIAFALKGLIASILTLFFPVLSQLYWLYALGSANGYLNWFTIVCGAYAVLYILRETIFAGLEKQRKEIEERWREEWKDFDTENETE